MTLVNDAGCRETFVDTDDWSSSSSSVRFFDVSLPRIILLMGKSTEGVWGRGNLLARLPVLGNHQMQ